MKTNLNFRPPHRPATGHWFVLGFLVALPLLGQIRQGFTGSSWKFPEYYEIPFTGGIQTNKLRGLALGSEGYHLSNRLFRVTDMHIEHYGMDSRTNLVARAPECLFDASTRVAWSTGRLEIVAMDGEMTMRGTHGFQVRMTNSTLTISNRVRTTIRHGLVKIQ